MYIILTVTVDDWVKNKKMKYLGVPKYIAHGTHQRDKENFRFMVMPRFGSDLQKIFEGCGKHFAKETVLALGLRMVYLYLNWLKNHRMCFLCIFYRIHILLYRHLSFEIIFLCSNYMYMHCILSVFKVFVHHWIWFLYSRYLKKNIFEDWCFGVPSWEWLCPCWYQSLKYTSRLQQSTTTAG